MSILAIVFLIIVLVILIVLIAAAASPSAYTIEREITIARPRQDIFDYIRHLENQAYYNKWVMIDPNARKTTKGTDGTLGYISTWDSDNKNAGKGAQEIKKIVEGERIELEIRFEKPFKGTSTSFMSVTPLSDKQTLLKWGFGGQRNYMMKVMHIALNLKKMLANDIQTSLANLKAILEKK